MSESQADRLLKIAETDSELAHKIADFMKDSDKPTSNVSGEKLVITEKQKKWLYAIVGTMISGIILTIIWTICIVSSNSIQPPKVLFSLFFITIFSMIILCWFFSFKAGLPVAKQFFSKHFEFQ